MKDENKSYTVMGSHVEGIEQLSGGLCGEGEVFGYVASSRRKACVKVPKSVTWSDDAGVA